MPEAAVSRSVQSAEASRGCRSSPSSPPATRKVDRVGQRVDDLERVLLLARSPQRWMPKSENAGGRRRHEHAKPSSPASPIAVRGGLAMSMSCPFAFVC